MKQLSQLLLIAFFAGLINGCSNHKAKSGSKTTDATDRSGTIAFNHSLTFLNASGDSVATIHLAIADKPEERNEGLMNVHEMPENNGMLFIFEQQQALSFWMANTPLPLDIIFVNKQKKIVRIHHSTKPYSEQNYDSGEPALYAVETNGGFCISHDIQEGMKIKF